MTTGAAADVVYMVLVFLSVRLPNTLLLYHVCKAHLVESLRCLIFNYAGLEL